MRDYDLRNFSLTASYAQLDEAGNVTQELNIMGQIQTRFFNAANADFDEKCAQALERLGWSRPGGFKNGLSKYHNELFDILKEESSEVIKEASKITRHGLYSCNPHAPVRITNKERLEAEIGDFMAIVKMLADEGQLSLDAIDKHAVNKIESIKPFLHHAPKGKPQFTDLK